MDLEGLSKKKHQRELDVGTKSLIMSFMRGLTFFSDVANRAFCTTVSVTKCK